MNVGRIPTSKLTCYSSMMPSSQTAMGVQPALAVCGGTSGRRATRRFHIVRLLAALADGRSEIRGYSTGGDCASTVRCLRGLGVAIEEIGRDASGLTLSISGRGRAAWSPAAVLDEATPAAPCGCCRNSPPTRSRPLSPAMTRCAGVRAAGHRAPGANGSQDRIRGGPATAVDSGDFRYSPD